MFIPLTINNALKGESWPNVLIAGDTAGVFYLLSMASSLEANIFLADTGIKKPLREFPCHRGDMKDQANVYYDFFDGRIGAGIVRRMDAIMCASYDLKRWARLFQVPAACVWHDASGTWLEFEGTSPAKPDAGGSMAGMVAGFVKSCGGSYERSTIRALVDKDGGISLFPSVNNWPEKEKLVPEESTYSAWDDVNELLEGGQWLSLESGVIESPMEDRKLIELGVPELDVLAVSKTGETRYIELTGDLARVFDGLF
jgi:hypothetical protein